MNGNQSGLQVLITGIPAQGAKSRVETQIKLGIQLVNQQHERVAGPWTHIKLPDYMVAKEKNKRVNAKNIGQEVYQALNNGTCLNLEADVFCQSDVNKLVQTCSGCVLRERKRAQRKKSLGKKKNTSSTSSTSSQMDEDDPRLLVLEQRKILLFNSTEITEFNTGELTLPTRITCYCRHHGEKQGFCIRFVLKDSQNNVVAMGASPPIMITDDHKASKVKKPDHASTSTVTAALNLSASTASNASMANRMMMMNAAAAAAAAQAQAQASTINNITLSNEALLMQQHKVHTLTPPSSPTTPGDDVESDVDVGTRSRGGDDTNEDDDDDDDEESEESEVDTSSSNASLSPQQQTLDFISAAGNNQFDASNLTMSDLLAQFTAHQQQQQQQQHLMQSRQEPSPPPSAMHDANGRVDFGAQTSSYATMNGYLYNHNGNHNNNDNKSVTEQLMDIPVSLAPPASSSSSPVSMSMDLDNNLLHHHQQQQHQQQQQHHNQHLHQQNEEQKRQEHAQQLLQQHLNFQQLQQQALFPSTFSTANSTASIPTTTTTTATTTMTRRTSTSGGVGPMRRRRTAVPLTNPLGNINNNMGNNLTSLPLSAGGLLSPSIPAALPIMSSTSMSAAAAAVANLPTLLGLTNSSNNMTLVPSSFTSPKMTRLIPNTGPCFGGIEVTILGANFYAGLTAQFDTTPAIPTQFWSPNTLICILPPRIQPGTTVVTFRELAGLNGASSRSSGGGGEGGQGSHEQPLMLFTYVDESDKALMELALQVVGLKMTGRLEDARNIALRIVGSQAASGVPQQQQQQQQQSSGGQQNQANGQQPQQPQQHSTNYATLVRELVMSFGETEGLSDIHGNTRQESELEDRILNLLSILTHIPSSFYGFINLARRETGQRLLHLGTMKGYERLVQTLVAGFPELEVNGLDMNGYSAIHYACWIGNCNIARLLVDMGANVSLKSVHGVKCIDLARMHDDLTANALLSVLQSSETWVNDGAMDGYVHHQQQPYQYHQGEEEEEEEEEQVVQDEQVLVDDQEFYEGQTPEFVAGMPSNQTYQFVDENANEDSGIWLEHFATESDDLEDEYQSEEEYEDESASNSWNGSEIEDFAWLERGEWIGEDLSSSSAEDSNQYSGSDESGQGDQDDEEEQVVPTFNEKSAATGGSITTFPSPSSPSLIPLAIPLSDSKEGGVAQDDDATTESVEAALSRTSSDFVSVPKIWLQKTLSQLQTPSFPDFEFLKTLNQILPEKSFMPTMPSMPTSIQAFNANLGTYIPYTFATGGKPTANAEDPTAVTGTGEVPNVDGEGTSEGRPLSEKRSPSMIFNKDLTSEVPPSRYLNVYHEPFSATSVLQQSVNSYAMPPSHQDGPPAYSTCVASSNNGGAAIGASTTSINLAIGTSTTTSTTSSTTSSGPTVAGLTPLTKVRRFYPPIGSSSAEDPTSPTTITSSTSTETDSSEQPQQSGPISFGTSTVVYGGRRVMAEIADNGAVVGAVAVAERAVEAVGENRHIQELRAKYHQKMKRLKKDKMLFLFWVPVLLVMLALTIIRIASTFDVAREWMGGLLGLAGIQV